jgi:tRNA G18 (ribose-2'-O)-methylase SpoU
MSCNLADWAGEPYTGSRTPGSMEGEVMSQPLPHPLPRGYFGIGAERISKSLNLGNLMRSAHGFGASFTFTIGAAYQALEARADTSKGTQHLPHYNWSDIADMRLPHGCRLVGVELLDDAVDLPSFRHPQHAAYVLGPELGALSEAVLARCDHVVRIPSSFCINVAMAGAIVMYDRVQSLGRFPPRPLGEVGRGAGRAAQPIPRKAGRATR